MLKRICAFLAVILLVSLHAQAASQTSETLLLTHPDLDQKLPFNVTLPDGYASNPDKRYFLLFDFHPRANRYLEGLHYWLSHNGEWPWLHTIIVTPKPGNPVAKLFDPTGDTTPLIDFFADQLLPALSAKYRLNGYNIFSGFRQNGTLVMSALLNRPDAFSAYIAVDPELKNDYVQILSKAQKRLKHIEQTRFLFLGLGENIKVDHQQTELSKLAEIVRKDAPENLDYRIRDLSEHYHMSLPVLSVIYAIEALFDDLHNGLAPDSDIASQGVDAIKSHYQYLSKEKYGFEVSPQRSIKALAKHLLSHDPQRAISILQKNAQDYADDAYAHHALANALASTGNYQAAVQHQSTAAELSQDMLTWHTKRMHRYLEEYQAHLTAGAGAAE